MRKNLPTFSLAAHDETEESGFRVFTNVNDDGAVDLMVMDIIGDDFYGDGITAKSVAAFLAANVTRDVNVRINSMGGDAYQGLTIYNSLANHPGKVTVTIEGLAYSAASLIAMAGDEIRMHEASDIGIHRAATVRFGNSKTFAATLEWLNTLDGHLQEIYSARTGMDAKTIEAYLDGTDDGTLFNARDAVKLGFADTIIPLKQSVKNTQPSSAAFRTFNEAGLARLRRSRNRA